MMEVNLNVKYTMSFLEWRTLQKEWYENNIKFNGDDNKSQLHKQQSYYDESQFLADCEGVADNHLKSDDCQCYGYHADQYQQN